MIAGLKQFHKHKKVDYKLALHTSLLGIVGAMIGACLIAHVSSHIAQKAVGILTLFLLGISLLRKRIKMSKLHESSSLKNFVGYFLFIFAGMIGGFFGGQAIIATYIFSLFFNKTMSESVGTRKVNGLLVALAAIAIYGIHDLINWYFSFSLIIGTFIGSTFGAKYALKKGDQWIEKIFNITVIFLSLSMLF